MRKCIPKAVKQQIVEHSDLLAIVTQRLSLKKRGQQYWACCPFHEEKTASFCLHADRQFFYCFGCGSKGNVIDFVMQYDRLDFMETMRLLSETTGIELNLEENSGPQIDRRPIYACLKAAAHYFQQQLRPQKEVIDYLKKRQLSGQIAKKYAIGYAPSERDALTCALTEHQKQLPSAGLVKTAADSDRTYGLFNHRLMFPIRDVRGRVIAFGGRVLSDRQQPKYLNSPEGVVFHKSTTVYGLYEALQASREIKYLALVEGYMDVVSLSQHGEQQAVATLGTAVGAQHFQMLFRYTDHVICCFDGDNAGQKAAWKALTCVLPQMHGGRRVSFIHLSANEDPDTFIVKHGLTAWQKRLQEAEPLSNFLFRHLQGQYPLKHLDDKAKFAHKTTELFKSIPGGLFKNLLLKRLAQLTGIDENEFPTSAAISSTNTASPHALSISSSGGNQIHEKHGPHLVDKAIALLSYQPELAALVSADDDKLLASLSLPHMDTLLQLLQFCRQHKEVTFGSMLTLCQEDDDMKDLIITASLAYAELDKQHRENEFSHIIHKLKDCSRQRSIASLIQQAREESLSAEQKDRLQQLIREKNQQNLAQEE